jgi:hypothetical protein
MSNDSAGDFQPREQSATPHAGREMFCIYSYAGQSGPACAWRGWSTEVESAGVAGLSRCPRCGRATLLEIPKRGAE